ncbi:MAG: hypothetical protein LBF00_03920 [Mycoplasmataceae bacterium]|jgi:hypothetical protein|nr:hypothetical protein [Mycoplasmataceae bacterium]
MKKYITIIGLGMFSILLLSLTTILATQTDNVVVNCSILLGFSCALIATSVGVILTQSSIDKICGYVGIIAGILSILSNSFAIVQALQNISTFSGVIVSLRPLILSFTSLTIITTVLIPSATTVARKIQEIK